MIFIVSGEREGRIVTITCDSADAAVRTARRLTDNGADGVLIDADGQEYAGADFERLFLAPPEPILDQDE